MKNFKSRFGLITLTVILISAASASAHQPRLNESIITSVSDPEISKAYYGKLEGEPHTYKISSAEKFDLYVGILAPDIPNQKRDVSFGVIKIGDIPTDVATMVGIGFDWKPFFEEFGRDSYLKGPEFRSKLSAGEYEIRVWSSNNDSKYSLAIGEIEAFDFKESMNAIRLIPEIKKNFFEESPAGFILSPFGYGYILIMFLLSAIFGLIYRALLKKFAARTPYGLSKNIGKPDRLFRAGLGLALFLLAVFTSWSPLLLFASGFCFFEAIFSWCGFYAALGKNTCPL